MFSARFKCKFYTKLNFGIAPISHQTLFFGVGAAARGGSIYVAKHKANLMSSAPPPPPKAMPAALTVMAATTTATVTAAAVSVMAVDTENTQQ